MGWQAWLTLGVIVAATAVMVLDRYPTAAVLGGGLLVLLVSGAVGSDTVLSGLSSPAVVTIAALYVVAAGVTMTGAMSWALDRMLFGQSGRLSRIAITMAALSSVVPNTPLVALAAPRVIRWCRRTDTPASNFLMPLSFATIFGGTITLLGTSTNLVISDGLTAAGANPLGVFEMSPVTIPVAIAGVAVLVLTAPRLLPDRSGAPTRRAARQFESQMVVVAGGALDGSTITDGGLRDLDGLYLAAVERDHRAAAATPHTVLRGGDYLYFVGDVEHLVDLQEIAGLRSTEQRHLLDTEGPGVGLYEAVISGRSDLSGRTLKDADFRSRYGAAVLAVERSAGVVQGQLGATPLMIGDVLVVLAGPEFARRWRDHGDFSTVATLSEQPPRRRHRAPVAALALAGMLVLAATGLTSLLTAALLAAVAVVVGGAVSMSEARHAVDLNVVLTMAASIGIGASVRYVGLADRAADIIVALAQPFGAVAVVFAIVIATQLLTELLSNAGAAAVMMPVGLSAAAAVGGDQRAYAIAVLIGASCSFLTPVGYQTNLMVYSLGGYRFRDFTRVGLPLMVVTSVVATAMLSLVY